MLSDDKAYLCKTCKSIFYTYREISNHDLKTNHEYFKPIPINKNPYNFGLSDKK